MKVRTYKTQSLQEGLEDIKKDLGSEALIVSTRSLPARIPFNLFRKPTWEITVALEERPAVQAAPVSASADRLDGIGEIPLAELALEDRINISRSAPAAPAPTAAVSPATIIHRDTRMDQLIGEIAELKTSLRSLSKAIPVKSDVAGILGELVGQGIDHDLADHLIATASQDNPAPSEVRNRVRCLLSDHLSIAPPAELHAKAPMVSIFVGPTGVGKTTSIAKIAGHAAIRMKKKVALISTDTLRIGGQEQLSRLGDLLGIPTYSCADVSTLKDLVASLDDRNLILIDTPGSSPSDVARLSKLETVTSAVDGQRHLVISATTRSEDITRIVARFKRFSPTSVIFTKIDETESKGSIAGDLLRNAFAVSYLTNGQRVPEDLLIPNADELARYVLPVELAI
jgi:flagellar biosynthesis protein FlhF